MTPLSADLLYGVKCTSGAGGKWVRFIASGGPFLMGPRGSLKPTAKDEWGSGFPLGHTFWRCLVWAAKAMYDNLGTAWGPLPVRSDISNLSVGRFCIDVPARFELGPEVCYARGAGRRDFMTVARISLINGKSGRPQVGHSRGVPIGR